jgi:hypothetical protein
MIDADCVLAFSDEKPAGVQFGKEYNDGDHATISPESFGAGA